MAGSSARIEAAIAGTDEPIILEFHGKHSTPCITQDDLLTYVSGHPAFPVEIGNINADDLLQYAERYGIKTVPSVVVVQSGKILAHFSGLIVAGSVISAIESKKST